MLAVSLLSGFGHLTGGVQREQMLKALCGIFHSSSTAPHGASAPPAIEHRAWWHAPFESEYLVTQ